MTIIPQKTCTRCKQSKPLDQFAPDNRHASGKQSSCRACQNAYKRQKRIDDPDTRAKEMTYALRYQSEHRETVIQYNREYRRNRRKTDSAYQLARLKKERERRTILRKTDPAYLERERAHSRKNARRYYADPERYAKAVAYRKDRYYNHPGYRKGVLKRAALAVHKRRAQLAQNGGSFTSQEWNELCVRYDHKCLCCGELKPLTIDHIIPISKGGSNDISNIQPLCETCNKSKHDKSIDYRTSHTD